MCHLIFDAYAYQVTYLLLGDQWGKVGHGLDLFRKGATFVAADFVAKVLNGRLAKTTLVGVDG